MPEGNDYEPADWSRSDTFASARAVYDVHVGRSYDDALSKGVKASDLVPDKMTSDAGAPIVILCDQTGSMGTWPATIFSKLGYLDNEAQFYFGDDYAIAFGAFGDANSTTRETYPVQMRPFATGADLKTRLTELVIEGKGGGQKMETSELAALYVDRNVCVPKAVKPILILITDEKAYATISPDQAKQWSKVTLEERLTTKALFESLMAKWSVYLIRKPYTENSGDTESTDDRQIRLFWEEILGTERIAFLPDAARVVDVIFGIFAQETGKIPEFRKELTDRQLKDAGGQQKIDVALKALLTIHRDALPGPSLKKLPAPPPRENSLTRRDDGAKSQRSKKLLDE